MNISRALVLGLGGVALLLGGSAGAADDAPAARPEKAGAAKARAKQADDNKKNDAAPVVTRRRVVAPRSLSEALLQLQRVRVNVNFEETPFSDVVRFVQQTSGMNVIVGPALQADGLDGIGPITLELRDVTLRQVAELVSSFTKTKLHLGTSGVLEFTTPKAARGKPVLRIYSIAEITMPLQNFPGPDINLHPSGAEFEQEEQTVQESPWGDPESVASMIQEMIDSDSWSEDGVSIQAMQGKLVVRQYPDVQKKIARLLALLRSSR